MKRLLALAVMLASAWPACAATSVSSNFNVSITLTSKCEIQTAPANINVAYTSFQAAAASATTSLVFRCTNALPIASLSLDATAITDNATNLNYVVGLTGVPTTGNGASQTVTVTATVAAGQSGTCSAASCTNAAATNKQRTLTLTY